jgi:hypothetical protein
MLACLEDAWTAFMSFPEEWWVALSGTVILSPSYLILFFQKTQAAVNV